MLAILSYVPAWGWIVAPFFATFAVFLTAAVLDADETLTGD
jgi:hypothetical protein